MLRRYSCFQFRYCLLVYWKYPNLRSRVQTLARAVWVRARSRAHPGVYRGRVRETKVRNLYINHTPNTRTLGKLRVDSHECAHNFFCASRSSRYIKISKPRYRSAFSAQIIVHDSQNMFTTRLTQKQYLQVPTMLC